MTQSGLPLKYSFPVLAGSLTAIGFWVMPPAQAALQPLKNPDPKPSVAEAIAILQGPTLPLEVASNMASTTVQLQVESGAIALGDAEPGLEAEIPVNEPDAGVLLTAESLQTGPLSIQAPLWLSQALGQAPSLPPAPSLESTPRQPPRLEQPEEPPSRRPLAEPSFPPTLPPVEELLQPPELAPDTPEPPLGSDETVIIDRFEFEGNTVYSDEQLAVLVANYTGREITLNELFEARSAVTQFYLDDGYVTSGAFIPPQPIRNGVVMMQIVEGVLDEIIVRRPEEIQVQDHENLEDDYITSRIALGAGTPLNANELLEALRLLQLDPRIHTLRAELAAGASLGRSTLTVDVAEASTFDVFLELNNERSPSVGSFRQQIELSSLNFAGGGETIITRYAHTRGSDDIDGTLQFFLNPRNGTLSISGGLSSSEIIEEPFDELELESEAYFVEFSYRQPIIRSLDQELALGLTASHQQNRTQFLPPPFGPRPLTLFGAEEDGEVRVSALRFFQEWNKRGDRQIFAVRSQFSFGVDLFDPTINNDGREDSRFFAWRGQAQWVRRLAEDTLLLVRGDVQLADDALLTLEQFGLGGQRTIRGYRQDLLLTDNGVLASAEVRIPIARTPSVNGLLQIAPFLDIGKGWNIGSEDPDPSTIVGTGIGLLWQMDRLSARFDWGIPVVDVDTRDDDTFQENGFYFSLVVNPF